LPHPVFAHACVFLAIFLAMINCAQAQKSHLSTNITGVAGLNTIPSARMDKAGTIKAGVATLDPYVHGFIGFQLADPFYVSLRQTAEISNINQSADRLYPGIDVKLRLFEESEYGPEVSLGLNSAFGHKRMASEYFAFSKRLGDFDLTGGLAWGRLGSAGHIPNPLGAVSDHFEKDRDGNSETPNNMNEWFTGKDIGFFAGMEYFTPVKGLSVKGEWGADKYVAEQKAFGFEAPSPWSVSVNYSPFEWVDAMAGVVGTDKLFARLSLQQNAGNWPGRPYKDPNPVSPEEQEAFTRQLKISEEEAAVSLNLEQTMPSAPQIGRAARILTQSRPEERKLVVSLRQGGIKGPSVTLISEDLESALRHHGSPEEIWQDASFGENIPVEGREENFLQNLYADLGDIDLILDNQISLSEEDTGVLYRSSILAENKIELPFGFFTGTALRLNLKDNLDRILEYRQPSQTPVRSDVESFAGQRVYMDRTFLSWMTSLNTDIHMAATGGFLEEMYAGYGGEILVRPFGKRLAIGADVWHVFKRNPYRFLGLGMYEEEEAITGHLNFWYEVPESSLTLGAKVGRYLGEDVGGTFSLEKQFDNGARLGGFLTVTDQVDADIFGGTTHLYSGIKLSLPIGNIPFVPSGSEVRLEARPFGRDTGQSLDKPVSLYELTEPMSYRQIARSWPEILN